MSKKDLSISEMKNMQLDLYEQNKEKWNDMEPNAAKNHMLYMIEEIGECISIIKKKGINAIMQDSNVRSRFLEEITDVQNYYIEILNRLKITPEEYSKAYIEKHNINMNRNYEKDNKEKYTKRTF
ncbi:MAG: nucleotide pyrophosphohydrolase [Clostridia bacterium]|nr:nucleotide pyrophosphohydrolase [Clostridium sp.]